MGKLLSVKWKDLEVGGLSVECILLLCATIQARALRNELRISHQDIPDAPNDVLGYLRVM